MEVISQYQLRGGDFYQVREGNRTLLAEAIFTDNQPRSRVIVDLKKRLEERLQQSSRLKSRAFLGYTGIGQIEGRYCFFQEEDAPLRQKPLPVYLEEENPSLEQVMDWLITLTGIAREAEEKGINWPGFNLESMRVTDDGELYLVDPGITALVSQYRPRYERALAQELYQPPDVIRGGDWDEGARLYSLGVLAYYLFAGRAPYAAGDKADLIDMILSARIVEPCYYNYQLSRELSRLIVNLLAGERAERPEGMEALLRELIRLKEENLLRAADEEAAENRSRSKRVIKTSLRKQGLRAFFRKRWGILAGAGAIMTVFLLTFMMGGAKPVITGETTPRQVVEYFYQSVDEKDVMLLEETTAVDLKRLEKMVTENYVLEKMRTVYSGSGSLDFENGSPESSPAADDNPVEQGRLFGIINLEMIEIEGPPQPVFRAEYIFYLNLPAEEMEENEQEAAGISGEPRLLTRKIEMVDEIKLERAGGQWQIIELSGGIENLINGEIEELIP